MDTYTFGPNARTARTIEDCELSDFHSLRGGYFSAIMVITPSSDEAGTHYTNRVAEVRRCQVRGVPDGTALATANSAGISFHDNVVVDAGLGMNADTATDASRVRNIDLTGNLLLDVNFLANVGTYIWPASYFTNITVRSNTVRLRSVPWRQEYASFEPRLAGAGGYTNLMAVSDPSLPVGRLISGYAVGLMLGADDQIKFDSNRFTAWPRPQFYEPDPNSTNLAVWYPLYRPATNPFCGQPVTHGTNLTAAGNTVSSVSMDFASLTNLMLSTAQVASPTHCQRATQCSCLASYRRVAPAGWCRNTARGSCSA